MHGAGGWLIYAVLSRRTQRKGSCHTREYLETGANSLSCYAVCYMSVCLSLSAKQIVWVLCLNSNVQWIVKTRKEWISCVLLDVQCHYAQTTNYMLTRNLRKDLWQDVLLVAGITLFSRSLKEWSHDVDKKCQHLYSNDDGCGIYKYRFYNFFLVLFRVL